MMCEECHGEREVWRDSLPVTGVMPGDPDVSGACCYCFTGFGEHHEPGCPRSLKIPCPSCGGSGISSCCEGGVGLSGDIS